MLQMLAIGWPGPFEMIILAGLGLLFFGKRLPEVGRSVGKTIVEFKKGMREVENEIHQIDTAPPSPSRPQLDGYKFDPYTGKPLVEEPTQSPTQPGHKFDPYTGKPIGQESPASTEPRP